MKQFGRFPLLLAGCFTFLQSADVLLTRGLLSRPDVGEANPLALAILTGHGWTGVVLFKLLCTAIVLVVGLVVCRMRQATGVRLLGACCVIVAGVVGYSAVLLQRPARHDSEVVLLRQEGAALDAQIAGLKQFAASRDPICQELLEGRLLFPEAVAQMTRCIRRHRACLPASHLTRLPDPGRPTQVAAYLMFHAGVIRRADAALHDRFAELKREAASYFPHVPELDFTAAGAGQAFPWAARSPARGPA